ncbi:MAG: CHAT domain-containing protein [Saprospiraceae bacterium]
MRILFCSTAWEVILLLLGGVPASGQTPDTAFARALHRESVVLTDSAQYRAATERLWEAAHILEAGGFAETALYAEVLHERGRVFLLTSRRPDSAIVLNQAALAIREKLFGHNSDPVVRSLTNIGLAYYGKSDSRKALEYTQMALDAAKTLHERREEALSSAYNNMGNAHIQMGNLLTALLYADSALRIREAQRPLDTENMAKSYHNTGAMQVLAGNFDRAVFLLEKGLAMRLALFGKLHRDVAATYSNLGAAVFFTGDNLRALELLETALDIRLRVLPPDDMEMAESYANLMLPLVPLGDYDRAIAYGDQVLAIGKKYGLRSAAIMGNAYLGWGNALVYKGALDEALQKFELAIQFFNFTKNPTLAAEASSNMAVIYGQKRDFQNQKKCALQFLQSKTTYHRDHPDLAIALINYGIACQNLGQMDSAMLFFERAEAHMARTSSPGSPHLVTLHNARALVLAQQGDFDRALAELDRAKRTNHYDRPGAFDRVGNWDNLLTTLAAEGTLWRSRPDIPQHLERAREVFLEACAAVDFLRAAPYDPGSKAAINARFFPLYEALAATDLTLSRKTGKEEYDREAFRVAEQSKSMGLFLAVRNSGAKAFAHIPADIAPQENTLRTAIARLEQQQLAAKTLGNETLADSCALVLLAQKDAFRQLQQQMKQQYPEYYALRYTYPGETLESAQSLLAPDQTLVEYLVGDSSVIMFALRADTFAVAEIKRNGAFPLDSLVRQLLYGLTHLHLTDPNSPTLRKKTADAYVTAAHALYQNLLSPVSGVFTKKIIVVPDGVLGHVPFDVLLREKPSNSERFQSHPYFGKETHISYAYSAALLREMRDKRHRNPPSGSLWALAPLARVLPDTLFPWSASPVSENRGETVLALPASGQEAADVAALFGGTVSQGGEATKAHFFEAAGRYGILHLCLHGKANERDGRRAWLAFAAPDGDAARYEKLYVGEIYGLALNADLVTLAACETAVGEFQRGEGIVSLARAFAYAGAKSIVASLWLVDDTRTAALMRQFYQNLKSGMDKGEALWQAKHAQIEQGVHPYFWSGFVPVGDMAPVARH